MLNSPDWLHCLVRQLAETCKEMETVRGMIEAGPKEEHTVQEQTRNNTAFLCSLNINQNMVAHNSDHEYDKASKTHHLTHHLCSNSFSIDPFSVSKL